MGCQCPHTQSVALGSDHEHGWADCGAAREVLPVSHAGQWAHAEGEGGTDVFGLRSTNSAYNFAEGYTNTGYDEWLTLQNPTNQVGGVQVTLINGQGRSCTFQLTLAAHNRSTVDLKKVMQQQMCHTGAAASCYQMSFTVQARQNGDVFVAERPMYFSVSGSKVVPTCWALRNPPGAM